MLHRLIYISRAVASSDAELQTIVTWCLEENPRLQITGALCFLDGVYIQYIEGEEDGLDSLFSRIRVDVRHTSVTLLERRAIPNRAFPHWAMKLLEWDDYSKAVFRSFSPGASLDLYAADPTTAAPLVRALFRGPDWKLT